MLKSEEYEKKSEYEKSEYEKKSEEYEKKSEEYEKSEIEEILQLIRTKNTSLAKFKNLLSRFGIIEQALIESSTINSFIAVSIQYQKFDIFQYLIDLLIPEDLEKTFIDYKLRLTSLETLKIFTYISIKYYKGLDIYLKYLISVKKIPIHPIAIYISAKNGHLDLVKYLFDNGCIITNRSISVASENGHFDIVYFLLLKIKNDLSIINISVINNIFSKGPINLIEFILQEKSIKIDKFSVRIIFECGRIDIITALIEKGKLPDIGPLAVRSAYENKHYDLVYFLLKQRFPVDITSPFIVEYSNILKNEGIIVNNVPYF